MSGISSFAFNVKFTDSTTDISLSGNIGEGKNNRMISLFTNENGFDGEIGSTEDLTYIGYTSVGYDGGFDAVLPSQASMVYITSDEITILKNLKNKKKKKK